MKWAAAVCGLVLILVTGCTIDPDHAGLYIEARPWYPSTEIRIPLSADGGVRYVDYVYEYNAGEGWTTEREGTIVLPHDGRGLLEVEAADPAWSYRLRLTGLGRIAPGQALEPVSTIEHYFRIDTTAPSSDRDALVLTAYQAGGAVTSYDPSTQLWVEIDHTEFTEPSGSPVRVYITRDDRPPADYDDVRDQAGFIDIWGGGESYYYQEVRFMVVDEAGNRSAVRTVVYESF